MVGPFIVLRIKCSMDLGVSLPDLAAILSRLVAELGEVVFTSLRVGMSISVGVCSGLSQSIGGALQLAAALTGHMAELAELVTLAEAAWPKHGLSEGVGCCVGGTLDLAAAGAWHVAEFAELVAFSEATWAKYWVGDGFWSGGCSSGGDGRDRGGRQDGSCENGEESHIGSLKLFVTWRCRFE